MLIDFKSVFSRVVKSKENPVADQYLAVKISQSEVLATLWSVIAGQVTIGTVSGEKISKNDFSGVLVAADAAVSQALGIKELPMAKTIFGVNPDWVDGGKVVEEKRQLLKSLCQELDLRPMGYVLLSDAVENYLSEVEGAPLTAILVSLEGNGGWVSLSQAGKNLGTVALEKEDKGKFDLASSLEKALKNFSQVEVLPARIILFDGPELKSSEEKIMAHPWTKNLPFLHFPKVEIVSGETVVKAVAAATGTQMGGKIETSNVQEPTSNNESNDETKEKPEVEEVSATEAGFVFGEEKTTITAPVEQKESFGGLQEMVSAEPVAAEIFKPKIKIPVVDFSKIWEKLKSLKFLRLPKITGEGKPKGGLWGVLGMLGVLGLIMAGLYFLPKAKIIIHVTPKTFSRELTATISGQTVETQELGTKRGVVTGRKLVGDKASGTVTVYGAGAARNFPAGTILASPDGLKFTLNQDVSIASASDFLSPATATSKITAMDIGDKYNLAPNTKFSLGGSSLYLAKNEATLTGGNSHEATVVTKADQDRLLATLSAELALKAQESLNAKLPAGQKLLPNAITATISKKNFSKEIGAEGDNISLDITVEYKGVTVSQADLLKEFIARFPQDIPAGYYLDEINSVPEIKTAKLNKAGEVVLTVSLNGVTLPKLDPEKIIKEIAGQSTSKVQETIRGQTGVSSLEITAKPKLFQFWVEKFLPAKLQNISVEIVSD